MVRQPRRTYIVGIGKNNRLREKAGALIDQAEWDYEATDRKQCPFGSVDYAVDTTRQSRDI